MTSSNPADSTSSNVPSDSKLDDIAKSIEETADEVVPHLKHWLHNNLGSIHEITDNMMKYPKHYVEHCGHCMCNKHYMCCQKRDGNATKKSVIVTTIGALFIVSMFALFKKSK